MNIVIDIRSLMDLRVSGVQTYVENLVRHLLVIDKQNTYILFANSSAISEKDLPHFSSNNVTVLLTKIPNKFLNAGISLFSFPKLDELILRTLKKHPEKIPETMDMARGIDLFLVPDIRPVSLRGTVKKILVVHDLSFLHHKKFFSLRTRLWHRFLNPQKEIEKSHHIIAVSDFTRRDVIQSYAVPSEKITVIYEGVDAEFGKPREIDDFALLRKKYRLPENYFLFLSTLEPRKNIVRILEAFSHYKKENPGTSLKLVVAGAKNPKIFARLEVKDFSDVIFPGFIAEEDKALLMKHAVAFLYPSLFEGFGLPILEAMKCGTPVITSRVTSMPEVAGDAALMIDPENVFSISKALEEIQDPQTRKLLQEKMKLQVKKFSWERCARETMQVMEKVLMGVSDL